MGKANLSHWRVSSVATACMVLLGVAVWGGSAVSPAGARPPRPALDEQPLAHRHSRIAPPGIVRRPVGALVTAEELERAFSRYRDALCERVDANSRSIENAEAVLGLSVTEAAPVKSESFSSLFQDGLPRRAGPGVTEWLASLELGSEPPCVALAAITLLGLWPEAEPADLLADLARHPPGGSVLLTINALVAMGETGRADYLDVLSSFVDPANDSRVVAKALRSAAVITGDAESALELARDETFPIDEGLAFGLARSLDPAEGPALDLTLRTLLDSDDPFRREAGLRAAALGTGMPAALPRVIRAAADPDLSTEAARYAVRAIERAMPGAAAPTLLDLARNASASPDARAAAYTAIADPPMDLGLVIARRQPAPVLLVRLAEHAERLRQGGALAIFEAIAATSVPREALVEAIRGAHDELLLDAGRSAFQDPGLWE